MSLARGAHLYVPRAWQRGAEGRAEAQTQPGRGKGARQNQALARLAAPESRRDPGQG